MSQIPYAQRAIRVRRQNETVSDSREVRIERGVLQVIALSHCRKSKKRDSSFVLVVQKMLSHQKDSDRTQLCFLFTCSEQSV